jgi:hypothetical protein
MRSGVRFAAIDAGDLAVLSAIPLGSAFSRRSSTVRDVRILPPSTAVRRTTAFSPTRTS